MRPRLVVTYLLIVIVPLGLLAWLGVRVAVQERESVHRRYEELLLGRLREVAGSLDRYIEDREVELLRATDIRAADPASIRARVRHEALARQIFVLDPQGRLIFPSPEGEISAEERGFLERTRDIWVTKDVFYRAMTEANVLTQRARTARVVTNVGERRSVGDPNYGWYAWYWGNGINLIFWRRMEDDRTVGVEIDHTRLLSDVVGYLPETGTPGFADPRTASAWGEAADDRVGPDTGVGSGTDVAPGDDVTPDAGIRLIDSRGRTAYQWGDYRPSEDEPARVSLPLEFPLHAWRLEAYVPDEIFANGIGKGTLFNLISGLVVVGIALAGLAVYFYRESSRELRDAAQRVTFVNQVSHELKTPLTSIRMYAELLENELPEEGAKERRYLDIIVSESQRLSRLIGNILTFGRSRRKALRLHPTPGIPDEVVSNVLERFRPPLEEKSVDIEFAGEARNEVEFDRDALEQILSNLFNNVEKYAAAGGRMTVETSQNGELTTIKVSDNGPGIPKGQRDRIFEPFHRIRDHLSVGVTGTGIGLSISRELARLHGGDLVLLPSKEGAVFQVTLGSLPIDGGGLGRG